MNRNELLISRLRRNPAVKDGAAIGIRAVTKVKVAEVDEEQSELIVIANTDDVDLEREVVDPSGADPDSYFFTNRKMFVDHDTSTDKCVAVMRSCRPFPSATDHRQWRVRCRVYRGRGNQLADDIWNMATSDGIGVSIGFIPLDYGPVLPHEAKRYPGADSIVRRWHWLELSFTAFPCNVACQSAEVVSSMARSAELAEMVGKGRIHPATAAALGLARPKRNIVIG